MAAEYSTRPAGLHAQFSVFAKELDLCYNILAGVKPVTNRTGVGPPAPSGQ